MMKTKTQTQTRTARLVSLATLLLLSIAAVGFAAAGVVNVNTASAEQLALLPRVGPAVATRIVEFRTANGPFKQTEELMLVQGIGERTFELIRPYIALDGETTLSEKVSSRSGESTE